MGGERAKLPWWGWPFIVACLAIPFYTLGGALPAAIGFGSAALTWKVAGKEWRVAPRVVAMAMITGMAWLLLGVVSVGVDMLRSTR